MYWKSIKTYGLFLFVINGVNLNEYIRFWFLRVVTDGRLPGCLDFVDIGGNHVYKKTSRPNNS